MVLQMTTSVPLHSGGIAVRVSEDSSLNAIGFSSRTGQEGWA